MALLQLPASLLMLLAATSPSFASPTSNVSAIYYASTGSGSSYASACYSARNAYSYTSNSWISEHATVSTQTVLLGGTSWSSITYYANATTLCDGHPRVTASPAVPLSSTTSTIVEPVTGTSVAPMTGWTGDPPGPSPVCSISPSDCDPLWSSYSAALTSSYPSNAITAAPQTPPCLNQSAASSYSAFETSFSGCGLCTIYGEGVELLYFPVPTTVSRDMCATTQSGSLTHYNSGDVLGVYAGKSFGSGLPNTANAKTAVVNGHTFTSGTAYISISQVYAMNRCSQTLGNVVEDAIIAMSSSAVLSLRYSQDHFQWFASTDQQTGYPVSYADFNSPIPYSAWIGQAQCEGPWDDYDCGIIYENNYRPQLAIPPGITALDPNWNDCQVYFRGLYDPPLALDAVATIAVPTIPFSPGRSTAPVISYTPASPVNGPTTPHAPSTTTPIASPTGSGTAIADNQPTQSSMGSSGSSESSGSAGSSVSSNGGSQAGGFDSGSNGLSNAGDQQGGAGSQHQHHQQKVIVYRHEHGNGAPGQTQPPAMATATTFTIFEKTIVTVIQTEPTAPVTIECEGLHRVITAGQQALTLTADGNTLDKVVMSAASGGVVVDWNGDAVEGVKVSSGDADDSQGSGSGSSDSSPTAGGSGSSGSSGSSGGSGSGYGPASGSASGQVPTQTGGGSVCRAELSAVAVALVALHFAI